MALTHKNRLKTAVSAVASSGLGAFTIGSAESGYRTFGASDDGNTFDVLIIEGTAWEVRTDCTYTHSGTSLARGTLEDSSTGSAIAFTTAAIVVETLTAGRANSLIRSPGGSTTQIQYNNSGAFAGSSSLTWNSATTVFNVTGTQEIKAPSAVSSPLSMIASSSSTALFRIDSNESGQYVDIYGRGTVLRMGGGAFTVYGDLIANNAAIRLGGDTYIGRVAAATVRLGDTNAASPVAQTLTAQGSRSSTDTNTAGANLTIQSGNGTGNATPSSLILQSPVAAASGTSAQTQTTGLTIKNGCAVPRATTVASLPAAASNTDAMLIVTDASATLAAGIGTTVAAGGANRVGVRSDGTNWIISF